MLRFLVLIGVLTLALAQGNDYGDDEVVAHNYEKSAYDDVLSGEDVAEDSEIANTENNDDSAIETEKPLNLSGYELMAIVDILMEISARPCPQTNVLIMTQIKKYLAFGLRHAPRTRDEHPLFFPNFMKLTKCLNQVEESYPEFKKMLIFPKEGDEQVDATQTETESSDADSEVTRSKRDVSQEESLYQSTVSPELLQNSPIAPTVSVGKYMAPINESLSFERLFALLLSIKDKACNQKGSDENRSFLVSALVEVLHSAANDSNLYKSAQLKYFHKNSVLSELELCEKSDVFLMRD